MGVGKTPAKAGRYSRKSIDGKEDQLRGTTSETGSGIDTNSQSQFNNKPGGKNESGQYGQRASSHYKMTGSPTNHKRDSSQHVNKKGDSSSQYGERPPQSGNNKKKREPQSSTSTNNTRKDLNVNNYIGDLNKSKDLRENNQNSKLNTNDRLSTKEAGRRVQSAGQKKPEVRGHYKHQSNYDEDEDDDQEEDEESEEVEEESYGGALNLLNKKLQGNIGGYAGISNKIGGANVTKTNNLFEENSNFREKEKGNKDESVESDNGKHSKDEPLHDYNSNQNKKIPQKNNFYEDVRNEDLEFLVENADSKVLFSHR